MDTRKLLEARGDDYGDTHIIVGLIIHLIRQPFIKMVTDQPELVHDYVLMLSKVIRIVFSPTKLDSYDDLIGYTTLARGTVERIYNDSVHRSEQSETPEQSE